MIEFLAPSFICSLTKDATTSSGAASGGSSRYACGKAGNASVRVGFAERPFILASFTLWRGHEEVRSYTQ